MTGQKRFRQPRLFLPVKFTYYSAIFVVYFSDSEKLNKTVFTFLRFLSYLLPDFFLRTPSLHVKYPNLYRGGLLYRAIPKA